MFLTATYTLLHLLCAAPVGDAPSVCRPTVVHLIARREACEEAAASIVAANLAPAGGSSRAACLRVAAPLEA